MYYMKVGVLRRLYEYTYIITYKNVGRVMKNEIYNIIIKSNEE